MASKFIYSTLSGNQRYVKFALDPKGQRLPREVASVLVRGGANVADRNFITPKGIVTQVTEDEYALLKENSLFQLHVKNGFITVDDAKVDIDKMVAELNGRDQSAPLIEADFENTSTGAPTVSAQAQVEVAKPSNKKK
jgi:hypothetical protein